MFKCLCSIILGPVYYPQSLLSAGQFYHQVVHFLIIPVFLFKQDSHSFFLTIHNILKHLF